MADIIAVFHTEDASVEFYDDFTFKQKSPKSLYDGIVGQWKIEQGRVKYLTDNKTYWQDVEVFTVSDFSRLCAEYEFDRQLVEFLGE